MAGNDDLIARLRKRAIELLDRHHATAGWLMQEAATALTEQGAAIERLTRERDEARATEQKLHRDMQQREGKLVGAHVKKEATFWLMRPFDIDGLSAADKRRREYIERLEAAEARAETAERERDEARARNVELQVLAHGWMVAHDMLKAGAPYKLPRPSDLPDAIKERDDARAEVERKGAALKRLLDVCPEEHGCSPRNRCQSEHAQADDDELKDAIAEARAALTAKGGGDGQS